MQPTSRIDIDLDAIERNVRTIRAMCSGGPGVGVPAICGVIKADAYGLGAPPIARRLQSAGVEMLAVYTPEQALALAGAGVTRASILILMPTYGEDVDGLLLAPARAGRLHLTAHNEAQIASLARRAEQLGVALPLHVEVDTGMRRGGAAPDLAAALVARIVATPALRLAGVCSHFACADRDDAMTREQHAAFDAWLEGVRAHVPRGCVAHQANSFALVRDRAFHRDMVRVGLALYGYAPEEARDVEHFALRDAAAALTPAVRWESRIIHLGRVESGQSVGYGATWRAQRPTTLGLAPVGYADGYPLSLSNKARVRVLGRDGISHEAPVVGAVSMDQITIDMTDLPPDAARLGAPVELIGADKDAPTHLPTVARLAGTISHELLCRLSPRIPRRHLAAPLAAPERAAEWRTTHA